MLKIFIAGCGRSGTTLMRHLFSSFDDCFIIKPESPFSVFDQHQEEIDRGSYGFAVAKRTAKTWKELARIPDDIFVIAMVRHPFDVMTSYLKGSKNPDAFYIPPERWVNETRALLSLEKRRGGSNMMFVRYEDLVSDPDSVQRKISGMTGISASALFSEARKISTSSVEKFRNNPEFAEYCRGIKEELKDDLLPFCDRFDYRCDVGEEA